MKKIIIASLLLFIFVSSCKKSNTSQPTLEQKKYESLVEVKKILMKKIISLVKENPKFKKAVEDECLKQVRGDYNVSFDKILEINSHTPILPVSENASFASLVQQMKDFKPGRMPILFVPVMETRDPKEKNDSASKASMIVKNDPNNPKNYITMVDQDNEVGKKSENSQIPSTNLRAPVDGGEEAGPGSSCRNGYAGYIIDDAGELTYNSCITETMAWNTDCWVLGYEEDGISEGNQTASSFDGYNKPSSRNSREVPNNKEARYAGSSEYGGRIQVTNMDDIEPWVRGKFEFVYYVYSYNGTLLKKHPFGKLKRSHFRYKNWTSLRDFIGVWNTSNWGDITYEKWIEEDGGQSAPKSLTFNYTSNGVTYSTTVSIPANDEDDDLGLANIQYTDPAAWRVPYRTGYYPNDFYYTYRSMNMQREDQ